MIAGSPDNLVKPPQSRDGVGESTVRREILPGTEQQVYVKRQHGYTCRPPWRGFRRTPTLTREHRAIAAVSRLGIAVPEVIRFEEQGLAATLVIAEVRDSRTLEEALSSRADRKEVLRGVGETIGRLHRGGWTHGALYSDHILVRDGSPPEIVLIDLEKSQRGWRRRQRADLARLFRRSAFLADADRVVIEESYRLALRGKDQDRPGLG